MFLPVYSHSFLGSLEDIYYYYEVDPLFVAVSLTSLPTGMSRELDGPARKCPELYCKNWISYHDDHRSCIGCLGLQHAQNAVFRPRNIKPCQICAAWEEGYLRRRLTKARANVGLVEFGGGCEDGFKVPAKPTSARAMFRDPATSVASGTGAHSGDQGSSMEPRRHSEQPATSTPLYDDYEEFETAEEEDLTPYQHRDVHMESPRVDRESVPVCNLQFDYDDYSSYRTSTPSLSCASQGGSEAPEGPSIKREPVAAVFERAVARLGLSMPDPEPSSSDAPPVVFTGLVIEEKQATKPRMRTLPAAKGVQEALFCSWVEGKNQGAEPKSLSFKYSIAEADALGLSGPPQMDPTLTASFAGRFPGKQGKDNPYVTGDKPNLSDPVAKAANYASEKIYRSLTPLVNDLNAMTLLQGSLVHLLNSEVQGAVSAEQLDEVKRTLQLLVLLTRNSLQRAGYSMATIISHDRKRWLAPMSFKDYSTDLKKHFEQLPMVPGTLFPGAVEFLQSAAEGKKKTQEVVSSMIAPDKPNPPPPQQHKPRSQSRSCNNNAESNATPPTTPPPPPAGQAGRGGYGDGRRDDHPPARGGRGGYYGPRGGRGSRGK